MTTDITELAQSLKAAAEKSGIEQWVNNRGEVNTADYEVDGGVYIDHICDCEIIGTESPRAEFIALANPANILALVEALEKAQQRIDSQREYYDGVIADGGKRIAELEDTEQKLCAANVTLDARAELAERRLLEMESRTVTIEPFRSFVTDADIAALHRFAECCDDPESGGHDLEKEQVRRLEAIGALQRSGRISYITGFGDVLISITAGMKVGGE